MNFNKDEPFTDPNDYYIGKKVTAKNKSKKKLKDAPKVKWYKPGKKLSWESALLLMITQKSILINSTNKSLIYRMSEGVLMYSDWGLLWVNSDYTMAELKKKRWYLAVRKDKR